MSEWSIVQSWNGCVRQRTPGSNPGLCATGILEYLHRYSFFPFAKEPGYPCVVESLSRQLTLLLNANPGLCAKRNEIRILGFRFLIIIIFE